VTAAALEKTIAQSPIDALGGDDTEEDDNVEDSNEVRLQPTFDWGDDPVEPQGEEPQDENEDE
jgi:hypothetical protein